jgi:hypothetical protein
MFPSLDNIRRVSIHGGICEKEGWAWVKKNILVRAMAPRALDAFPMVIHVSSPEISIPYYLSSN